LIGDEVRRRREKLGLTGAQLAAKAGMAPSAVSQIETGRRTPSSTSVLKLATALGVEVGDLYPKKAQAPLPLENGWRRGAEGYTGAGLATETWPYWTLYAWVEFIRVLIEDYEPIIRDLPENPSGKEYTQAGTLLGRLLRHATSINKYFLNSGVVAASNEVLAASKTGEGIPQDLEQKVREFHELVDKLNGELVQPALYWLQRIEEYEELHSGLDEHVESWRQEDTAAERQGERVHKKDESV